MTLKKHLLRYLGGYCVIIVAVSIEHAVPFPYSSAAVFMGGVIIGQFFSVTSPFWCSKETKEQVFSEVASGLGGLQEGL